MTDKKMPKNAEKYICNCCDFKSSKYSNYISHILTRKHKNVDKMLTNVDKKNAENADHAKPYICYCGRQYKHRQSLFVHKKKCHTEDKNEIITNLMKENKELKEVQQQQEKTQNIILELLKATQVHIHSVQNIQMQTNKTFNLNFYLNETCKNAMNITDFVDSVKLQLNDLIDIGEKGYVTGISNIIVKNLNALETTQRPIQCADAKREIIYIKDHNKWDRDDEDKSKMRKVIKTVTNKNIQLLSEYKATYIESISTYSGYYDKLIIETIGGIGDQEQEKENKIIKNIVKEFIIDKTKY
jgi:hypothetical protein